MPECLPHRLVSGKLSDTGLVGSLAGAEENWRGRARPGRNRALSFGIVLAVLREGRV